MSVGGRDTARKDSSKERKVGGGDRIKRGHARTLRGVLTSAFVLLHLHCLAIKWPPESHDFGTVLVVGRK